MTAMESDLEIPLPLFVSSRDEAMAVKKTFEQRTGISYVIYRTYAGKEEISSRSIHFVDKSGVVRENEHPFLIVQTDNYQCMFGRDRHAARKLQEQTKDEERMMEDYPVSSKRKLRKSQSSQKKGCPASMVLKEVILFTDYKMNMTSEWEKRQMSKAIRDVLDKGEVELSQEHRVYIKYPMEEDHQAVNELGPLTGMLRPIATEIASKIDELVRVRVWNVSEMRRHLKRYIEKKLFPDPSRRPSGDDSAYYPDSHTLAQMICALKLQLRMWSAKSLAEEGGVGQECAVINCGTGRFLIYTSCARDTWIIHVTDGIDVWRSVLDQASLDSHRELADVDSYEAYFSRFKSSFSQGDLMVVKQALKVSLDVGTGPTALTYDLYEAKASERKADLKGALFWLADTVSDVTRKLQKCEDELSGIRKRKGDTSSSAALPDMDAKKRSGQVKVQKQQGRSLVNPNSKRRKAATGVQFD